MKKTWVDVWASEIPVNDGKARRESFAKGGKTPAWQRSEGKNPEGGLNQKGVDSYKRDNPGSKLKTAVTTKPSKLKKDSKSAIFIFKKMELLIGKFKPKWRCISKWKDTWNGI